MVIIETTSAQRNLDSVLDAAQKEPVTITRHDQPVAVVVSAERYAQLEAAEDSMWAARAREAAEKGFIGEEETREFIQRKLDADS